MDIIIYLPSDNCRYVHSAFHSTITIIPLLDLNTVLIHISNNYILKSKQCSLSCYRRYVLNDDISPCILKEAGKKDTKAMLNVVKVGSTIAVVFVLLHSLHMRV